MQKPRLPNPRKGEVVVVVRYNYSRFSSPLFMTDHFIDQGKRSSRLEDFRPWIDQNMIQILWTCFKSIMSKSIAVECKTRNCWTSSALGSFSYLFFLLVFLFWAGETTNINSGVFSTRKEASWCWKRCELRERKREDLVLQGSCIKELILQILKLLHIL